MESPSILRRSSGFTLIEILISLGVLVIIASLGLFVSFDFYRHSSFQSERSVIVSVLQKARNQSVDNIDQTRHGVHFEVNPVAYVIFECSQASPQCTSFVAGSSDLTIAASYGISFANPNLSAPFDVVFDQLSGDCVSVLCTTNIQPITINDGTNSYSININSEGRIDW